MKKTFSIIVALLFCTCAIAQVTMGAGVGMAWQRQTITIQDFKVDAITGQPVITGYHDKQINAPDISMDFLGGYKMDNVEVEGEVKLLMGSGVIGSARLGYDFNVSESFTITPFAGITTYLQPAYTLRFKLGYFFISAQRTGDINGFSIGFTGTN